MSVIDSEQLVVRIGVSAWGLPTWDVRSLELLFLLHFNRIPHIVEYERYGYTPSTGEIPSCEPGDGTILSAELSINKFCEQLDKSSGLESALPFRILCESRLLSICEYALFEDDYNFNRFVYSLFSSIPFPFCAYLPRKIRRQKLSTLKSTTKLDCNQRLRLCEEALQIFESMLETSKTPFLFGSKPSSSDAALCSFVMFARCCPIDFPHLKQLISPTLTNYISHILKVYSDLNQNLETPKAPISYNIPETSSRNIAASQTDHKYPEQSLSVEELKRQSGNRIAIGIAAATFIGFFFLNNLNNPK